MYSHAIEQLYDFKIDRGYLSRESKSSEHVYSGSGFQGMAVDVTFEDGAKIRKITPTSPRRQLLAASTACADHVSVQGP